MSCRLDVESANVCAVAEFVKRRDRPATGSVPEVLGSFVAEVRFYREIAPVIGVRVPACHRAEDGQDGTLLVLEDLSGWSPGADPEAAAGLLRAMHERWVEVAPRRWPWLRPVGAGADVIGSLYGRRWPKLAAGYELGPGTRIVGEQLVGKVAEACRVESAAGALTLAHGDASMHNLRTGPENEIALLDWEDVRAAPGLVDLAWLLVSSVPPERWDDVVAAYGPADRLGVALPAAICQGLLSLADAAPDSADARGWIARLEIAARQVE